MKTEIRKVTVEREVYIAIDGKEFNDKDDCESYEYELLEKKLQFYDDKCGKSDLDSCTYVKLISEQDVADLISICAYHGISCEGISSAGIYMYDNYNGWLNITEVISNIYGGTTSDD